MFDLLLAVLATYGIAVLFAEYDGPFNIFSKLRSQFSIFRCAICVSIWAAIPVVLLIEPRLEIYLATIGGVIALERVL